MRNLKHCTPHQIKEDKKGETMYNMWEVSEMHTKLSENMRR